MNVTEVKMNLDSNKKITMNYRTSDVHITDADNEYDKAKELEQKRIKEAIERALTQDDLV